jgi:hypothetical protein
MPIMGMKTWNWNKGLGFLRVRAHSSYIAWCWSWYITIPIENLDYLVKKRMPGNGVICNGRETQHPEPWVWSHTGWDFFFKNLQKPYISIRRGVKLTKPSILVVNWVSSCLSFFSERLHCCCYIYLYFHYSYLYYNFCNYIWTLCIRLLSFSISYWDLIKFPYFADTTERGDKGWKEAQIQGEENRVTLRITLICAEGLVACYIHTSTPNMPIIAAV